MPREITVALVQHGCTQNTQQNLDTTVQGILDAAQQGAELVALQELHRSVYFCQAENPACFDLAESIPGPSTERLCQVAKQTGVVIIASLFERRTAGLYHNTAVVIERDGSIAGKYRKMHIPDDPGYYEKFYFTPGDLGFEPIPTSLGKLGVLICWDQWFPEAARLMALAGAEMLIYPTAIGWDPNDAAAQKATQRDAWITIQRAHAIANGVPVIVCNRTGFESDPSGQSAGIDFWGTSFIAGPQGEILISGPSDRAAILTAKLDLSRTEQVRRMWPYFRDRRVDAYCELTRRYRD